MNTNKNNEHTNSEADWIEITKTQTEAFRALREAARTQPEATWIEAFRDQPEAIWIEAAKTLREAARAQPEATWMEVDRTLREAARTQPEATWIEAFRALREAARDQPEATWMEVAKTLREVARAHRDSTQLEAIRATVERPRSLEKFDTKLRARTIHLHMTEEPLTAQNFTIITSALTELHTKFWLIQQERFSDLTNYAQTHDKRFTKEANLTIGKISHSSPALIELILNPATLATATTLAVALKLAVDGIIQTPLRYKSTELDNKKKELELRIQEKEAQQILQIAARNAEIENKAEEQKQKIAADKAKLELRKQQLELEQQQLDLDKQLLEAQRNRTTIILEIANQTIDAIHPNTDPAIKGMLAQTLLPNLLQLSTIEGWNLILPTQDEQEKKTSTD